MMDCFRISIGGIRALLGLLQFERIQFLAPPVAHDQRRAVGSNAHFRDSRVRHRDAWNILQRNQPFSFGSRHGHAVDCRSAEC